jgi:glycosyltransferase involved in cell wall biosynthesis
MTLPTVHYLSYFEPSGYGLSAIAMVRTLRNSGYPVRWTALKRVGYEGLAAVPWPQALAEAHALGWLRDDESLSDLQALVSDTCHHPLSGTAGFAIAQVVPEHLRPSFLVAAAESAQFKRIAYTTWESDQLPLHWLTRFDACDHIVVPSSFNQAVFSRDLNRAVSVVPHAKRHRINEFSVVELAQLRRELSIMPDEFVFYSINQMEPRKGWADLIAAYLHAFDESDKVALLIKTSPTGWGDAPFFERVNSRAYFQRLLAQARVEVKANLPKICLIDEPQMSGRAVEALHHVGDCYVSLTHGEGFGMSACDAACLCRPVLMTGWGGQLDFLGTDYVGNLPYALVPAPVWPPEQPSFWPSQRWAKCLTADVAQSMRNMVATPQEFKRAAQVLAERIHPQLSEPTVAAAWANIFQGM